MAGAPTNGDETASHNRQAEDNSTAVMRPVSVTRPQDEPSQKGKDNTRCKRRWTNDPGIFWVTFLSSLVVATYTALTFGLLVQTKESVELSRASLEATQRPWVFAAIQISGPFEIDSHGARLPLEIRLKNTGNSPALNLFPTIIMIDAVQVLRDSLPFSELHKRWCTKEALRRTARWSQPSAHQVYSLFPNEEIARTETPVMDVDNTIRDNAWLSPFIIVCIDYSSSFEPKMKRTAYGFRVARIDPRQPDSDYVLDPTSRSTASQLLVLRAFGSHAD